MKSNDRMIRTALVAKLLDSGLPRDCIRHEITLDSSSSDGRADLVIIRPGYLVGVEIKSGVDTLNRLAEQRPRYSARFDRVVLVCDEKHKPWSDHHSHWQGWDGVSISLRDGRVTFPERSYWGGYGALLGEPRHWSDRSGHLSSRAMLEMLWAAEITPAAGTRTRTAGIAHLAENRPLKEIRDLVCDALRTRQLNRWEERFWCDFDAARVAPAIGGEVADRAADARAP